MLVTRRIDGKARAARLVADVTAAASALKAGSGIVPGLCAVLVGNDPASQSYVGSKGKAAIAAGIESFQHRLPETTSEAALLALIDQLNADDRVDGILVQLPLPKHIDQQRVIDADRSGEGRGWVPRAECRPFVERRSGEGARSLHALRLPPAAEGNRAGPDRGRGGRARAFQHCR